MSAAPFSGLRFLFVEKAQNNKSKSNQFAFAEKYSINTCRKFFFFVSLTSEKQNGSLAVSFRFAFHFNFTSMMFMMSRFCYFFRQYLKWKCGVPKKAFTDYEQQECREKNRLSKYLLHIVTTLLNMFCKISILSLFFRSRVPKNSKCVKILQEFNKGFCSEIIAHN